jgi:hypothetical protein
MFRTFFMKYKFPLAYAATKVLANHVHESIAPRAPRLVREPNLVNIGRKHTPAERAACIHQIALALPRVPAPEPRQTVRAAEPIYEARSAYSPCRTPSRPAAIKSNGGVRGSTATKWR